MCFRRAHWTTAPSRGPSDGDRHARSPQFFLDTAAKLVRLLETVITVNLAWTLSAAALNDSNAIRQLAPATRTATTIPKPAGNTLALLDWAVVRPGVRGSIGVTLFLHGAFTGTRFVVWGETPANQASPVTKPRGRQPKVPPLSPFDPGPEVLAAALRDGWPQIESPPVDQAVVWLPSKGLRPLASRSLIESPPEATDVITIAPWRVSALSLPMLDAVHLLSRCAGRSRLATGVFAADDLAFWVEVLRFAGALVARGSFLPDLIEEDKVFRARWYPVVLGKERGVQARLVEAMPDACRAVGQGPAPPESSRAALLADFLDAAVDSLVRLAAVPKVVHSTAAQLRRSIAARSKVTAPDTLDDRWLAALCSAEPRVDASLEELVALRQRCREWRRPVAVVHEGPFRLCFRLEEPAPELAEPAPEEGEGERPWSRGDAAWTLRYLIQSNSDPSLIVPVAEAWHARGRAAAAFKADGFDVRDFLLSSLGRALRLCPILQDSLHGGLPDIHVTDAAGAVSFLTDYALILEQAGFGVLLPAWWTAKGTKLRLSTRAEVKTSKMQGGNGLSLDDVVRFDWQVALGDQSLSRADLMALAKLKAPLVRVRGQWVLLDAEEIKDAIARLKRKDKRLTGRDALRIALGGPAGEDSMVSAGVEVRGWIADVLARLENRDTIEPLPLPNTFEGELRPYQERGYAWLQFLRHWGLGGCLADDMGLGKTVQTLALILYDREKSEDRTPVLLVCPTSVIGNWQREAVRFTPGLAIMAHHGGARGRGAALRKKAFKHDVVITSYALLQRDIAALEAVSWKGVILDEAQYIKNSATKQARAARGLSAGYRIALTGTPVENNVGDLWSIMEFLNPGLLGSQTDFKRRFFLPIQTNSDAQAIERLKTLTGPFILRRLKSDRTIIDDLPEKMEMKVYCNLTREQGSLYAAVVDEAMEALTAADGIQRKGVVLATLSKLKQVCNHPAQFLGDNSALPGRSGKLARLVEMLEEVLAAGDRALVFTQFTEMGEIIKSHLQETFGEEVLFLHGGVTKTKRDRMVESFQGGAASVFLLSLKAGGTGLNLTAANHVFHFDRWWNPAVENQATDRAFRIGQTRRVQVHKFLCLGTLEEKIDEMIERKQAVASAVVGAGDAWLTELTTEQLSGILKLQADAIGG